MNAKLAMSLVSFTLILPALVSAQDDQKGASNNPPAQAGGKGGSSDKELTLELDKEELGESAGQMKFIPEKSGDAGAEGGNGEGKADKVLYKTFKHKNLDAYDKLAVKKGIIDEKWADDAMKKDGCKALQDGSGGNGAGQDKKDEWRKKTQDLGNRLAMLDSAKKQLRDRMEDAKNPSSGDSPAKEPMEMKKLMAADKLVDKELKKSIAKAKKVNDGCGMEIFPKLEDLKKSADSNQGADGNNPR